MACSLASLQRRSLWTPIAAFAIALLTLTGCQPDPPPVADDTLDAIAVFPEGTQSLSMVNLQHLKDEAGISFFSERGIRLTLLDSDVVFDPLTREQRNDLNAFIEASGFNPDTDLHAAYVGAAPVGDEGVLQAPLLVLRADFTRARLASSLREASDLIVPVDEVHDIPVFAFAPRNGEDGASDRRLALLDNHRVAVGDARDIEALLERIDRDAPGFVPSADDRELIGYASQSGSAWSVLLTLPEEMDNTLETVQEQNNAQEWQRRLARVATVTRQAGMGVTLSEETVQSRITLVADDNARDVRRLLQGVASGAQSYDGLSADQRAIFEDIAIDDQGRFVHIDINTTQRALAEMILSSR